MSFKTNTIAAIALSSALISSSAFAENENLTMAGDYLQIGVPLFAATYSLAKGDMEGFWQAAEGAVYTSLVTHALKATVDEERPNGADYDSFPSGHTSAAMQGAAFLTMRYGWEIGVPATAVAAFVGYTRVEGDYHYTHDVLAGTAIAWGVQYAITEMGFSPTKFIVSPFVSEDGGYGVNLSSTF
ncbi:phosphatase PAP2 family protein [Psychromonas sp. SP041]|uniref:phosphatase PAP2 family protein n=1 Tax=Psychromonas sp. SP041 TaxID=1365007 RepID=UPI0003FA85F2|nr:phosphatase PAP2 family protein [Psychromonas sp. SP041]